jgi:hypothetical protein
MLALLLCFAAVTPAAIQQPQAARGNARGGGGGTGPEVVPFEDHTGFESIFDGKTLNGWDGDPTFWRVENGALVGESTAEKPVRVNTFAVWRGGQPKDFELKVEFRISANNSGIQYRSVELNDVGKWVLKGYQADIDFQNTYTGQIYEERGRGFLAMRGQVTMIQQGQRPKVIGSLQTADELKSLIKVNDWNQFHVIARGNRIVHVLNGRVFAEAIDDDLQNRALAGLLGLQLHTGAPMKAEFRNIWLKNLRE